MVEFLFLYERRKVLKLDTKVVRASTKPDKTTGSVVPPIYQTATYVLEEVGVDKGFDYTRASNPSRQLLEEHLAEIEGSKYGVCFSSGMAAVDSVLKLLSSGDHVICSDDVYGGVSRHFNNVLVHYGIEFTYVNTSNPEDVVSALNCEVTRLTRNKPVDAIKDKVVEMKSSMTFSRPVGLMEKRINSSKNVTYLCATAELEGGQR